MDSLRSFLKRHTLSMRLVLGAVVLAACVVALVVSQKVAVTRADAIGARLELAAGEVTLERGDTWATVVSGIPLGVGAQLRTGKGARALVRMADGSSVLLRGDSQVALTREGLSLERGEAWLDAPPAERGGLVHRLGDVSVSAAEAGLSMRREADKVSVYVTRGLAVVMAPSGRVEVNAGEQATVAGGSAPVVKPLAYWEDWTGGMGDHRAVAGAGAGAGRIYGVDIAAPGGTPARTLEISRQSVRATVRDGLAETEVDQTFSNPGGRAVEGWYWFTVPETAIVTSFAVETDGALVEGEVIEKQQAAAQYQAAVRAAHEPALLEWIDGRSYRARIYPVPASGARRVVLRYMQLLPAHEGSFVYVYPMRSAEPVQIGELSLSVDLGDEGKGARIATLADAVIEDGGKRVTMRRSGYEPRADFQLEAAFARKATPFKVARFAAGEDRADYLFARYVPDVDWAGKELPGDLALVVDTSASADEAARQQKTAAAEAILRALAPEDRFTLIALDSSPKVLHPKEGLAEATDKEISIALERLAEHATGGSTDLASAFDPALGRLHGKEQPALIYIGDGLPTSGETSGAEIAERLRRSLSTSRARFFTVAVGAEANHGLLRELARVGGGQAFRIDEVEGSTAEVLRLASAIKTPTITDLSIDLGAGLDEPMLTATGKISRGEEVVLLARTHHALPTVATVKGRLGGAEFTRQYPIALAPGVATSLVPRLWAMEKVRRLLGQAGEPDQHRGKIVEIGLEYGLVTPFTSTLALESEQAYQRQGIQRRRSTLRGVRLTELTPRAERDLLDAMAPVAPPVAFGCSKMAPSAERSEDPMAASPAVAQAPAATAFAGPSEDAPRPGPVADKREAAGSGHTRGLGGRAKAAPDEPLGRADVLEEKQSQGEAEPPQAMMAPEAPSPPPPPGIAPPRVNAPSSTPRRDAKSIASTPPKPAGGQGNDVGAVGAGGKGLLDPAGSRRESTRVAAAVSAPAPAPRVLGQCSDSARRPLAERLVVWNARLRGATTAEELITRYEGARRACELPDWRAQSALLSLVQAKVTTEGGADTLLTHFTGEREAQKFVAHAILRRSVDARVAAAVRRVLFDGRMRWADLDEELAALPTPEERISKLRQVMLGYPSDPEGELRLVRLLAESNQKEEALAFGRRLRDRGFMSPTLALQLGDVLANSGFEDDAVRTYSEIVEFDPQSAGSRRLLGDVYLRHGWYAAAYRQYKTLTDIAPSDATAWLRLASAAAGSGRVDEALRLQRQVAVAEGTPGRNDPRAWARLLSAARIARLLSGEGAKMEPGQAESLGRKLKELQVFSGPAALVILTWEDHGATLSLAAMAGEKETPAGDVADAAPAGLTAVMLPASDLARLGWRARWRDDGPGRDVPVMLHTLVWDGKAFQVTIKKGALPRAQKEIAL